MKREFFTHRLRHHRASHDTPPKIIHTISGQEFIWTDMQNPNKEDLEEISKKYNLNELNVEDCITKSELAKLDHYDDHFFAILHLPPITPKKNLPRHNQLAIFAGRNFLITVHNGDLEQIKNVARMCENETKMKEKSILLGDTPWPLLYKILDVLVDDLLHAMRRVLGDLEEIEEIVFSEAQSAARDILVLRRDISTLKRIVHPLKRFIQEIAYNVKKYTDDKQSDLSLYFDDIIDHIDKVLESLEEAKETMEIYKDTDFTLSTEKTNRVLAILTMIFTLGIPATILGTFYGMNVPIPGVGAELGILGEYTTFVLVIIASTIPAGFMLLYFRKAGWI